MILAKQMHQESEVHKHQAFNEQKVQRLFQASITKPEMLYFRLAVKDNEVLGGFYGMLVEPYFTDVKVAKDLAWFITPDKRGGILAVRLVRDFEVWAKKHGAIQLGLGQSTGVQVEQTQKLYERLGYRVVGVNTIKDI